MPGRSCGLVWMSSGGKPSHMVGCCVHEGSLVWDYAGIEDVVLVDSSSGDHGGVGFQYQKVGEDGVPVLVILGV